MKKETRFLNCLSLGPRSSIILNLKEKKTNLKAIETSETIENTVAAVGPKAIVKLHDTRSFGRHGKYRAQTYITRTHTKKRKSHPLTKVANSLESP